MKRLVTVIMLVFALLLSGGTAEAQSRKKSTSRAKKKTTYVIPVTKGEVRQYGDFLTTQIFTAKKGKDSEIKLEYPISGKPELVNAIRKSITELNPKFTGSLDTPEAFMRSVLKDKKDVKVGEEGESLWAEFVVVYATPNIVTFSDRGYEYAGGAHGMPWRGAVTFLVEDGTKFDLNMLPSFTTMRPYILEGVADYFDTSVSNLGNYLYSGPDNVEDYPGFVAITDKGIVFYYQPYEIAPYSAGAPEAPVPVTSQIIEMLSPAGQRFFK